MPEIPQQTQFFPVPDRPDNDPFPLLEQMRRIEQEISACLAQDPPAEKAPEILGAYRAALVDIRVELCRGIDLLSQVHHWRTVAKSWSDFIEKFGPKAATRTKAQIIFDRYLSALKRSGIELIGGEALVGQPFDPRLHQKLQTAPVSKKHPHGVIVAVALFGVRVAQSVLHPPQVIVADENHIPQEENHESHD